MPGALANSPAEIVRQILIDLGHAVLKSSGSDWPAFVNNLPNRPDNAISVNDTEGVVATRLQRTGEVQTREGFQIIVRAQTHTLGWQKANDIVVGLAKNVALRQVTVGTTGYTVWSISGIGNVLSLGSGDDDTKREFFSINGLMTVKQN